MMKFNGLADKNGTLFAERAAQHPCLLQMNFTTENGKPYCLVDYASAGLDWETDIAAWLPTK